MRRAARLATVGKAPSVAHRFEDHKARVKGEVSDDGEERIEERVVSRTLHLARSTRAVYQALKTHVRTRPSLQPRRP